MQLHPHDALCAIHDEGGARNGDNRLCAKGEYPRAVVEVRRKGGVQDVEPAGERAKGGHHRAPR